ncbi:hypothetical protein DPMN_151083 [Dreissena polymorpha]|uniref:Uncharacterized protein n=1 Tax=Dreissena polymorpha TaxID=45954 RepID=A0A9D4FFT0_DREPO|nr:hypothetical protein DPMN_151083 [Dreissena polymorpha]
MKKVYAQYDLECKDMRENAECSSREFAEYVLALFPHVQRKKVRIGQQTISIYVGLHVNPLPTLKQPIVGEQNISPNVLPNYCKCISQDADKMTCEIQSDFLSDGNPIVKTIYFKNDYSFQVFIGDVEINLASVDIDGSYNTSFSGINEMCKIVKLIKLCEGVKVSRDTICSRLHVIENLKNKHSENNSRQIRSIMCNRVV